MIACTNLVKFYGKKKVLDGLSFRVREGEIFGLLGPNGAGKTTTIKAILGLTSISGGKVEIEKGITLGYSPETPYFHSFLSVEEVMDFYGKLQKISKIKRKEEISRCLVQVGLEKEKDVKVGKLSKGMLQRLAVAQALLGNPKILILDEPSAGLDAIGRIAMKRLILNLKQEGRTILLNSHILNDVETTADRVLIIKDGCKVTEVDIKNEEYGGNLENLFVKEIGGELL